MTDDLMSLSGPFADADEAHWLDEVDKALSGAPVERLTRELPGGLQIRPLYREADAPVTGDPLGHPGAAPYLRGARAAADPHLPWDIRQAFAHPDPAITNVEILRDLERGVSSIELHIDPEGVHGCAIHDGDTLATALKGVRADIATIALERGPGLGLRSAALLALWAETQAEPKAQRLAFNIDPLGNLARSGIVPRGLEVAFAQTAALADMLSLRFPLASILRIDARRVHEAGGSDAQELGCLIAHGVDVLRRLDAHGLSPDRAAPLMLFTLAVDANYGVSIAKLRAARRLWARCLEALKIDPHPMALQAVTSARMLARYDPWVNMLRCTAACFGAAIGGADIITVRPFTDALGIADELGRRVARNTQVIAMEESGLGRVADPAGGAWFEEGVAADLAEAAWAQFQQIERDGGYGASLMADAVQARIGEVRAARMRQVATRRVEVTGVSAYPTLDQVHPPVAHPGPVETREAVTDAGLRALLPALGARTGDDDMAAPLWPVRLAAPFERLRDVAETRTAVSGERPAVFLAPLGPLAEHNARADFARNFFAAGGIEAREAPIPPQTPDALAAAWTASGTVLAILCGSDQRYGEEAADAARALKAAGVQRLYLAGRPGEHEAAWREAGIDSFVHIGVDVVAALELAHAELGLA